MLSWSADELPAGLAVIPQTGRIVGNPTQAETLTSTITVTDGQHASTVTIDWNID